MSVAARATSIAARVRPSIGGAVVLAAIAAVPWVEQHRHVDDAPIVAVATSPELGFEADPAPSARIVLDPWDRLGQLLPQKLDVIVPPRLRDARPWPEGMVIGMGAPSVDPGILLAEPAHVPLPSVVTVLSAILGPWSALAGLRGT